MTQRLTRLWFALWLGILALAANGFEQRELGLNVLAAATEIAGPNGPALIAQGFHVMPDGRVMAGAMRGGHDAGGHTHKGFSDCEICGTVAELAAIALPTLPVMPLPAQVLASFVPAALTLPPDERPRLPYASRAPPLMS